jgi:integrase
VKVLGLRRSDIDLNAKTLTVHQARVLADCKVGGVPISIISKWAGHYDSSFTMKTYVHASDDDLKQGRQALAKIPSSRLGPARDCERHGPRQA